ncbi:hypothetical protein BDV26DRAFT_298936 [Aspergillus bertholletiae]|uniref:Uncharacterized protein n=1 Tax=Aspergillus bertholletiae TaxID=1226010 RepID=A0A5N7AR85_9EURO|nr:hypothetical protein BDV26DRAFT_298936 [Aspergillus bertholletiae]
MAALSPVTSLYVRYVEARMLKHNDKTYEAPKKYSKDGKELDEKYEKHLQSIIDAEIIRVLEESADKVLDISKYSEDPQKLKNDLQLLVDGVQYRAQEKGDDAHKAIEKLENFAALHNVELGHDNSSAKEIEEESQKTTEPATEEATKKSLNEAEDVSGTDSGNGSENNSEDNPNHDSDNDSDNDSEDESDAKIKYPYNNVSAKDVWRRSGYSCPKKGRFRILFQETTARKSKTKYAVDGYQCNFGVEKYNEEKRTYYREIVSAGKVADLLETWKRGHSGKKKMILTIGSRRKVFSRTDSGAVTVFHWFAYMEGAQRDKDKARRNPVIKCCVEFEKEEGPQIVPLTDLERLVDVSKLEKLFMYAHKRDGIPLPSKWTPKEWKEKNWAYHDMGDEKRILRGPPATWREIKEAVYEEEGIAQSVSNRRFALGGEGGSINDEHVKQTVREMLENERERTNARFQEIERDVQGVKSTLDGHGGYLQEILGLLKDKASGKDAESQARYTKLSISRKLQGALGGSGDKQQEREETLPAYESPSPKRTENFVRPSIEV